MYLRYTADMVDSADDEITSELRTFSVGIIVSPHGLSYDHVQERGSQRMGAQATARSRREALHLGVTAEIAEQKQELKGGVREAFTCDKVPLLILFTSRAMVIVSARRHTYVDSLWEGTPFPCTALFCLRSANTLTHTGNS